MKRKGIFAIKLGYNPNSSSIGLGIRIFLWSSLSIGLLFAYVSYIISRHKKSKKKEKHD